MIRLYINWFVTNSWLIRFNKFGVSSVFLFKFIFILVMEYISNFVADQFVAIDKVVFPEDRAQEFNEVTIKDVEKGFTSFGERK